MAVSTKSFTTRIIQTQNTILPRQVITQTITYADYTTTAIVTLGPGEPSSVPLATPGNSQGSQGLSSAYIGIIIGSVAGAVVLAVIIWAGCIILRRMREEEIDDEDPRISYIVQTPQRPYWPRFPFSIPPPVEPNYRATLPRRTYTTNGAARRATTSFVFYDEQRH
ncbi:hypothetical protein F5B21DRAFT_28653 [Xylaria acuta]|nr:hypothetical protein F5B21DRAFT_28653 [Xylaria acuta]